MLKKIILLLIVLSSIKLIAQEEKKLELSVGSRLLFPISYDWYDNYLVGVSTGLGFVISHQTILSGSIAYLPYISNEDSPENVTSLLGLAVEMKRVFPSRDSSFNAYLQLEAGFFIPIADAYTYSLFPELCGSVGLEFLLSRNTFLFFDVGYMLGITSENIPKLISGNVGVNFRI
jgi:hypothetical protein